MNKLKELLAKAKAAALDLWNQHKLFFIIAIPLIVLAKFRDILIDMLIQGARREGAKTEKIDDKLNEQETIANTQADDLVKQAKDLSAKNTDAGLDWNKKK